MLVFCFLLVFGIVLDRASSVDSFLDVLNDKAVLGTEISISGKKYKRGIGVHAPSNITYKLRGKYSKFVVTPGPDDAHKGDLEMKILVDGDEKFNTGKVKSVEFKARQVVISVKDAEELTLIVTDAGNGQGGDHASWADAYLLK